ncbi:MAG: hypothetical protein EA423_00035, partial [Phycisphaerales bacterium]
MGAGPGQTPGISPSPRPCPGGPGRLHLRLALPRRLRLLPTPHRPRLPPTLRLRLLRLRPLRL